MMVMVMVMWIQLSGKGMISKATTRTHRVAKPF